MNPAVHNDFLGSFDPAESPRLPPRSGDERWRSPRAVFAGAPVWQDSTGEITVSGEVVLDNAAELRRVLGMPCDEDGGLLAEAFRRFGNRVGCAARGMFAVAIHDAGTNTVHLLRDGVGALTMYWSEHQGTFSFATRLAKLQSFRPHREVSAAAVRDYLVYSYVPGAQTMWRDVHEVRPGTMLSLPARISHTYWEPHEDRRGDTLSIEEHAAGIRDILEDAIAAAMPSGGEPVGVFLSGGLDSSLVTALVARYATGPVHTYSVHFGSDYANELEFSDIVAKHCGTTHHVLEVNPQHVVDNLSPTMAALDDPIGDPLTVPNLLLGRRASEDCEVIFNGEGGDPCFGGPKNHAMLLHRLYGGESDEEAYLRSYRKCYSQLDRILIEQPSRTRVESETELTLLQPFFGERGMTAFLNQLMHINVRLKGADHILTKVNNLTRAIGLRGHSPLFDRRLVDASFAVPPQMKLSGVEEKVVLKRAVSDLLPDEIINRRKSGMMVPVNGWMRRELKSYVSSVLFGRRLLGNKTSAMVWRYIEPVAVKTWLNSGRNESQGSRLWMVLSLELWLRAHKGDGQELAPASPVVAYLQ